MTARRGSFRAPFLAFTLFVVIGMSLVSSVSAAQEPPMPLFPDLRTRPLTEFRIDTSEIPGKRLLRFTNEILNQGRGPVELRPEKEDCNKNGVADDDRSAYQHVYKDTETVESPGVFLRETEQKEGDDYDERFAGCSVFHPAHDHWHFEDFARYELRPMTPDGPAEAPVRWSDKVSYCLVDTNAIKTNLPGFSPDRYYGVGPVNCAPDQITGISVGWADLYASFLADQWINIGWRKRVPDGTYCLISTVDPSNKLLEADPDEPDSRAEINNSRSIRLKIKGLEVKVAPRRSCSRAVPPA